MFLRLTNYTLGKGDDPLPLYFLTTKSTEDMNAMTKRYYAWIQTREISYLPDLMITPTGARTYADASEIASTASIDVTLRSPKDDKPALIWIPKSLIADIVRKGIVSPSFCNEFFLEPGHNDVIKEMLGPTNAIVSGIVVCQDVKDFIFFIILLVTGRRIEMPRKRKLAAFLQFLSMYAMNNIIDDIFYTINNTIPHLFCVICEYNHLVTYRHVGEWEEIVTEIIRKIHDCPAKQRIPGIDCRCYNIPELLGDTLSDIDKQLQSETYIHYEYDGNIPDDLCRKSGKFPIIVKMSDWIERGGIFAKIVDEYKLAEVFDTELDIFTDLLKTALLTRENIRSPYVIKHIHAPDSVESIETLKRFPDYHCSEQSLKADVIGHLLLTQQTIVTQAVRSINMNDAAVLHALKEYVDSNAIVVSDRIKEYVRKNKNLITEYEDWKKMMAIYNSMCSNSIGATRNVTFQTQNADANI